jgi:AGZA family xanthine/uracil permease-like MFS transporter
MNWTERVFKLQEHGTNVRTELVAGLTTFLTMAYIIFVNPSILGDAGMPKDSVFVATCLIAALGTTIMGLYANYPIALAPGMGLNAYFAYVVVLQMGFTWQAALGAVFVSGCLFLAITLLGLRGLIIRGIPLSLRYAITVGIGLFLALIALKSAGIVAGDKNTFVTLGDLHQPTVVLAVLGFVLIAVLDKLKVPGAILIGIVAVTIGSFFFGGNQFRGVFSMPPSIEPTLFQLDIKAALTGGILNVILVFFLVELFDATGTLMGVAQQVAAGRQWRHLCGCAAGHLEHHGLCRERRRRAGRWPHGAHGADGGRTVPGLFVHRAAGRCGAGLRDGARAVLRGLPHAA